MNTLVLKAVFLAGTAVIQATTEFHATAEIDFFWVLFVRTAPYFDIQDAQAKMALAKLAKNSNLY
jgi:hypothetical protein